MIEIHYGVVNQSIMRHANICIDRCEKKLL